MPTEYWVESGFLWSVRTTLLRLAKRLYSLRALQPTLNSAAER